MAAGQLLRTSPKVLASAATPSNKSRSKRTSELILLGIVWNSFSNAFSAGVGVSLSAAATLLGITSTLHLLYFHFTSLLLKKAGSFTHGEITAASFVASHKTLAFGLPLIKTVFEGDPLLPMYCAPLMLIHPAQLFIGGVLAGRRREEGEKL